MATRLQRVALVLAMASIVVMAYAACFADFTQSPRLVFISVVLWALSMAALIW